MLSKSCSIEPDLRSYNVALFPLCFIPGVEPIARKYGGNDIVVYVNVLIMQGCKNGLMEFDKRVSAYAWSIWYLVGNYILKMLESYSCTGRKVF